MQSLAQAIAFEWKPGLTNYRFSARICMWPVFSLYGYIGEIFQEAEMMQLYTKLPLGLCLEKYFQIFFCRPKCPSGT